MIGSGTKLHRSPPVGMRKSKVFESPLERSRVKKRRNKSAPTAKRSEEMQAVIDANMRDKLLTEYYESVRKSTANVKKKLIELESLGGSESDGALMGLQPPSYASLGIHVGGHSHSHDYVSSDDDVGDNSHDKDSGVDGDDESRLEPASNASLIVSHLKETSAWLKKATGRGLDHIGEIADAEDTGIEEEKDIKEPSALFGPASSEVRMRTLLKRCEEVKLAFSRNLSKTLESEHRRMKKDVQDSGRRHKALDARKEALRADIMSVDRQMRKYRMNDLKIREMIEERLMPRVRQLEAHAAKQIQTLESHESLFLQTQQDLQTAQELYSRVTRRPLEQAVVVEETNVEDEGEGGDGKSSITASLMQDATAHVASFMNDLIRREAEARSALKAKTRQNDLSIAAAKRQKKKDADSLARTAALCTSLTEQLEELSASISRDRPGLRQQAKELAEKVLQADREQEDMEELYEEFVRTRRRKAILQKREGKARAKASLIKKEKEKEKEKRTGGGGEDRSTSIDRGLEEARLEVSVEEVLEHGLVDSDAEPPGARKERGFEKNGREESPLQAMFEGGESAEDGVNLDSLSAEDAFDAGTGAVLGMGRNSKARKARLDDSHSSVSTAERNTGSTLLSRLQATNASLEDSAVRLCQIKRPARSLVAAGCYLSFCEVTFPEQALPAEPTPSETRFSVEIGDMKAVSEGSSDKPSSESNKSGGEGLLVVGQRGEGPVDILDTHARAMHVWERERVALFDLPSGLLVLEKALTTLHALSLIDPDTGERLLELARILRVESRALPALFPEGGTIVSSMLEQTSNLEARLREMCVEALSSIASFAPRTLLLRNQRPLLATALQGSLAILGAYLHVVRHGVDCIKEVEEDRPCIAIDDDDLESVSTALVRMICTGTSNFVPSTMSKGLSPRASKFKRGNRPRKETRKASRNGRTEDATPSALVEPCSPRFFVHGIVDQVLSVPAAEVASKKEGLHLRHLASRVMELAPSPPGEGEGEGEDDGVQSFTLQHRRCIIGCIVYLIVVSNRRAISKRECDALLDQALATGRPVQHNGLKASPLSFRWHILGQVSPRVVPGVVALDLLQRFLDEELGRKAFITSIARREPEVAHLQFLNVTMSKEADKEIALAAARHRQREKDGEEEKEKEKKIRGLHFHLAETRRFWLEGMTTYVNNLCRRVLDTVWRARLADSCDESQVGDVVVQEHQAFPLPPNVQNRLLEHVQTLQAIIEQRSEDGTRRVHALEPNLHGCVRDVFRVIEMLVTAASAWEGPLAKRLLWLQRQMLALEERAVVMKSAYLKKKNEHDIMAHKVEVLRAGLTSYGDAKGKSLVISTELRRILEDFDDGGMSAVLVQSRKKHKELTKSLEDLKERLVKARKEEDRARRDASGGGTGTAIYGKKKRMKFASVVQVVKNLVRTGPPDELTGGEGHEKELGQPLGPRSISPTFTDETPAETREGTPVPTLGTDTRQEPSAVAADGTNGLSTMRSSGSVAFSTVSSNDTKEEEKVGHNQCQADQLNSFANAGASHVEPRQHECEGATQTPAGSSVSQYDEPAQPGGSASNHFDFSAIGPGIIFVNEVHTFPQEQSKDLAPLVRQYVLIERNVQRSLAKYVRHLEVKEQQKHLQGGKETPLVREDFEAAVSDQFFALEREVGEAAHDQNLNATTQSQPQADTHKERHEENPKPLLAIDHQLNALPRAKRAVPPGLSILHPAIVSILNRSPLSAQWGEDKEWARRRQRAAVRAKNFIEGDHSSRDLPPTRPSDPLFVGQKERSCVPAWLYDMGIDPPPGLLLHTRAPHASVSFKENEEGQLDPETSSEEKEKEEEEELFEGLFFSEEESMQVREGELNETSSALHPPTQSTTSANPVTNGGFTSLAAMLQIALTHEFSKGLRQKAAHSLRMSASEEDSKSSPAKDQKVENKERCRHDRLRTVRSLIFKEASKNDAALVEEHQQLRLDLMRAFHQQTEVVEKEEEEDVHAPRPPVVPLAPPSPSGKVSSIAWLRRTRALGPDKEKEAEQEKE